MTGTVRVYTLMIQPLLCLGIESLLKSCPSYIFAGQYEHVDVLLAALEDEPPGRTHVVLTDFTSDWEAYPQLLATLRRAQKNVKVLFFLSPFADESLVLKALRVGADGYLYQSATEKAVLRALEVVTDGRAYLEPQVTPLVLEELRKPAWYVTEQNVDVHVSSRERMLMQLAVDGLSNVQIAEVLGLQEKTVRNLWSSLFEKIGYKDRTQAVLWAIRSGFAELR